MLLLLLLFIRTKGNVSMSYAHRVGTGNREHGLVRCCKYFFSVTSNKSLSGQGKTLIRQRALWGAYLCAPSFAADAKRPIFACCYFIISANRCKRLCRMRTVEIQITVRNKYVKIHTKMHIPIIETKLILRIRVVRSWSSLSANLFTNVVCFTAFNNSVSGQLKPRSGCVAARISLCTRRSY